VMTSLATALISACPVMREVYTKAPKASISSTKCLSLAALRVISRTHQNEVAFARVRTSNSRQDQLAQSRMTHSGHSGFFATLGTGMMWRR